MNTKMISASAADRADFVNTQFQNYAVAPDDAGRKLYKNKILDSYKEALSNIEINPVEYGEKVRNLDLELGKSRANYDIYVGDPIKAAKNLDEGAYGIKDEDPKVWAGYKDAAIAEYKKRQTTNRLNTLISQNEKTAELTKRVFAGEALPQEVYKYRALEWIDDGTKSALIKYIESSKEVDPSAESSAYGELVADFQLLELTNTNIAVSDRLVGLAKFRKKVVEFRTAGKMTQSTADNFTDLINFAFTPTSEKKNGEPTGNIEGINKEIKNKYNNTRKALGLTRWWRLDIADNARIKKVKAKVYNLIMNADKIGTFNREELDAFVDDAIKTELADAMMDYNYNSPDVTTVNGDVYTKGDTKVIKGINYEYKGNGKWKKIS